MPKSSNKTSVVGQVVLLSVLIVALSFFSVVLWDAKPEEIPEARDWVLNEQMRIAEFAEANNVTEQILKEALHLTSKEELSKTIGSLGFSLAEIIARVEKAFALQAEHESKNWIKIRVKFVLWTTILVFVFVLLRHNRVTSRMRKSLYAFSIVLFGVIFGSDPSPMGTVKDAIALYGAKGAIFPPRMVALAIFLLMVVLANKFICSWGCQLGTLQDLLFRLNRDSRDRKGILRQYKIPFFVSNGVRILFFILFTIAAFLWAIDIVEPIDPFKVYKPQFVGIWGGIFIAAILLLSMIIYRPWCSLFCPFGLVGWLFEKISLFKVKVNYDTCIACEACARACPSTVMEAILKRDRVIPDCFACGTCIEVCPTHSISFSACKRVKTPVGKFTKDKETKRQQDIE